MGFFIYNKQTIIQQMNIKINEVWKPIIGYEGYYLISNLGNIKRAERTVTRKNRVNIMPFTYKEKILTPKKSKFGYLRIGLTKDKIRKFYFIHRLVFETFIGEIIDGFEIDHINTDKSDNRLENLRMVTPKENRNNMMTLEHYKKANKINSKKRERKINVYKNDVLINTFNSLSEAAEYFNINVSGIGHCCKGDFETYKGMTFQYNNI